MGDGGLTIREAGRRGGERTLARHGREHFAEMGRKGGASLSFDQHSAAGAKGGRATWGETHPLPGLKAARRRAGLSQRALAERSGLSRDTVGALELRGRASAGTIAKLAAALGVGEAALLGG
jgi:DNA-binding XRE family transcriptional regulator